MLFPSQPDFLIFFTTTIKIINPTTNETTTIAELVDDQSTVICPSIHVSATLQMNGLLRNYDSAICALPRKVAVGLAC